MRYAAKSDKGMVREINEDSYSIITDCPGIPPVFIVADGMGGHSSGEIASRMAVEFARDYILRNSGVLAGHQDISQSLCDIMKEANLCLYGYSMTHVENFGMGTTLIIAVISDMKLYAGHVGDSRIYLIRDGAIRQITVDHSYIEELIRTGSLTREEASNHPKRNVITRALGCFEDVLIDTYHCDMRANDIVVICTDGLTNMLRDNEISDIVEKASDPETACDELVRKANEKGGEDNITVIVIKIEENFDRMRKHLPLNEKGG